MRLSFSTMRLLHECPHNYVNKISGIKQPESPALIEGKLAHRIMQDHVSGTKIHPALEHMDLHFPVVERVDFDPNCKFEVPFGDHSIFGFVDGLDRPTNDNPTVILEGKFSSSPWSLGKYKKDPQRKIYGWALRTVKVAYLITGKRTPDEWADSRVLTRKVKYVEKDYADAEEWMSEAIRKINEKDFYGDLVDGKCIDPRCYWAERCMFK